MKTVAICSVFAFLSTACAADPSQPSDHMTIYETCLETQCDQMSDEGNSACHACEDACFSASYDCDPTTACDDSCSPRECSDYDKNTCLEQGFKVVPPNNPNPAVAEACNAALTHISSCGYTSQATVADCDRYAHTENDGAIAAYQCMAQVGCASLGDASATAACEPAPTTFGDDFCTALAAQCPSNACSADRQNELDADAGWLRPDALDAARSCLSQPSCDETAQCISTWISAVE